jgi:hypothetical protein
MGIYCRKNFTVCVSGKIIQEHNHNAVCKHWLVTNSLEKFEKHVQYNRLMKTNHWTTMVTDN